MTTDNLNDQTRVMNFRQYVRFQLVVVQTFPNRLPDESIQMKSVFSNSVQCGAENDKFVYN